MIDKDLLARAALQIAQMLGKAEEWDEPDQLLEGVAQALHEAGLPALDTEETRPYWRHMSVDDALETAEAAVAGTNVNAYVTADGTTSVTVNIDASQATEATIRAVFDGMRNFLRSSEEPRTIALPAATYGPYDRSADL